MYKLQEGRSTQNTCMTSQSAGLPVWIRATEGTLTVNNWRCQNFLCAATPNGPGRERAAAVSTCMPRVLWPNMLGHVSGAAEKSVK